MICCIFFFQAEDGIRDHCVTGVQTCALPISLLGPYCPLAWARKRSKKSGRSMWRAIVNASPPADRKSTRLNSSHTVISYAVFCLKKKKKLQCLHEIVP